MKTFNEWLKRLNELAPTPPTTTGGQPPPQQNQQDQQQPPQQQQLDPTIAHIQQIASDIQRSDKEMTTKGLAAQYPSIYAALKSLLPIATTQLASAFKNDMANLQTNQNQTPAQQQQQGAVNPQQQTTQQQN